MKLTSLTQAIRYGLLLTTVAGANAIAQEQTVPDGQKIERIMVTGQKYDRSLQETTSSVSVMTAKDLEQQNITDVHEVLVRTANVTSNGSAFNIRGIDAFSVSGGGSSTLASIYIDGAVQSYRAVQHSSLSVWDVAQVEVLRGPQSTLQGRNTLAGAVIVRTTAPSYEWSGKARLGAGQHGKQELAGAIGGAIIDDQLAFRFSAEKNDYDGSHTNVTRNDLTDFEDEQTMRLKVLFEPSAIPGLKALFSYVDADSDHGVSWTNVNNWDEQTQEFTTARTLKERFDNPATNFDANTHQFTTNKTSTLEIDYEFNDVWSAKLTSTVNDETYGYEWDGDTSPIVGNTLAYDADTKSSSHELLFNVEYDNLVGVFGAYYSDTNTDSIDNGVTVYSLTTLGVPSILKGQGLNDAQIAGVMAIYAPIDPVQISSDGNSSQEVTTKAIFADLTWTVNNQLDVFGGLRYNQETLSNRNSADYQIVDVSLMPDPANPLFDPTTAYIVSVLNQQLLGLAAAASSNEPLIEDDFSAWLPKLGATWRWSDDVATSFTVQKGYRSGGVGINSSDSSIYTYDEEYTWNYEVALRSVWLDGDLTANANIYYIDWQNQQVSSQLSDNRYDVETVNNGSSEVYGFETELNYHASSNLSAFVGLGYTHTEFKEFVVESDGEEYDLSGRAFVGAPRWTLTTGVNYRSDNGLIANVNANYQTDSLRVINPYRIDRTGSSAANDPKNDARLLVNLRAGYEWDNVGLYLTVNNLLDKNYFSSVDTGSGFETIGERRLTSVRLEAKF